MTRSINPNNKVRQLVLDAYRSNPAASLQELVAKVGYSRTAVYYHLSNLKNEGVITRENKPRGRYVRVAKVAKSIATNAGNAFRPNATNKKRTTEQKRIDMVVETAKAKEAAGVIDSGVNIFYEHRIHRVLGRKAG